MSDRSGELPRRAREKYLRLCDLETEAADILRGTVSRTSELNRVMLLRSGSDLSAEREEHSRLLGLQAQQQRRHTELSNGTSRVRQFLMALPATVMLEDAPRERVKPRKGESISDALQRVRKDISGLASDLRKLYQAGPRAADLKRAAKNYVNGLAQTGRPKITASHEKFEMAFETGAYTLAPNVRAILAWFDPDGLIRRLEDEIDALPVPPLTLSAKEKNERIATAKANMLAAEREEEALIELASDSGQQIIRRYHADPAAILGVVVKPKKVVAA